MAIRKVISLNARRTLGVVYDCQAMDVACMQARDAAQNQALANRYAATCNQQWDVCADNARLNGETPVQHGCRNICLELLWPISPTVETRDYTIHVVPPPANNYGATPASGAAQQAMDQYNSPAAAAARDAYAAQFLANQAAAAQQPSTPPPATPPPATPPPATPPPATPPPATPPPANRAAADAWSTVQDVWRTLTFSSPRTATSTPASGGATPAAPDSGSFKFDTPTLLIAALVAVFLLSRRNK